MAKTGSTLNQLAVRKSSAFMEQVDNLTENAPIVAAMPFKPSSDQLWDVSSEITAISGMDSVDLNAPLPEIEVSDALRQTQLAVFGAEMFVPEDAALLEGGPDKYFAKNRTAFERQTGMDVETRYIYNAFLPFALAMHKKGHKTVINAGGTGNKNYSLLALRFDDINLSGLYSPLAFDRKTFLDMKAINNGALYHNPNPDHRYHKVLGYGMRMKTYMGVRMLSHRNIGAIVNIDLDTATPFTRKMVNQALLSARNGEAGKTMLICHPQVKLWLNEIGKVESLRTGVEDKDVKHQIESWDGATLVTSYNFMDRAEANISL